MALTVCMQCDKTYGERKDSCPYCGCHNFYSDEDTYVEAINHLCDDLNAQAKREKKEKLRELRWVRFKMKLDEWGQWLDAPSWQMVLLYVLVAIVGLCWLSGIF